MTPREGLGLGSSDMAQSRPYPRSLPPLRYSHGRYETGEEKTLDRKKLDELLNDRRFRMQLMRNRRRQTLPLIGISSASTPTVPLPTAQGVHGSGDGVGPSSHPGKNQEGVVGVAGGWDPRSNDLQKLKELDIHGSHARPLSRNSNRKERVHGNRSQEELRTVAHPVTDSKQPILRANGLKTNLLRADHLLGQHTHGSTGPGPEEDLVAMGSLWGPNNQLQTRASGTVTATTSATTIVNSVSSSSSKSHPAANANGNGSSGSGIGGGALAHGILHARRPVPVPVAGTGSSWHSLHHSSVNASGMGNIVKSNKDADPKYSDPVPGAPASFQQRLVELAALEAETVRWERSKKVKKKPLKQDKDS